MTKEPSFQILLVEDNPINQQVAMGILLKWGHEIDIAENGLEALEKLETRRYDLILMDVQMPKMSGLEATMEIREREQDTGDHIPIIGLTAQVLTGDREACILAGMDDYVPKPIKKELLFEALSRVGNISQVGDNEHKDVAGDAVGVLDMEALALLKELEAPGVFSIDELIDTFVETTPDYLNLIEGAIRLGDGDAVSLNAHALKGSCQSVGAARLAQVCERLESMGKEGLLESTQAVFDDVRIEFDVASVALRAYLKSGVVQLQFLEYSSDIFDPTHLEDLRSLEKGGNFSLKETRDLFFQDASQRLLAARNALLVQDCQAWSREAHTIKGGARDLGAVKIADLSQQLETLGRCGDEKGASDLLDQIEAALEAFQVVLDQYLSQYE